MDAEGQGMLVQVLQAGAFQPETHQEFQALPAATAQEAKGVKDPLRLLSLPKKKTKHIKGA